MSKIAIYPGTFDPITYGHIDVIKKSLKLFKKIVVAVSGGLDSMVLLDLLIASELNIRDRLVVAHYNHQLRGEESDAVGSYACLWSGVHRRFHSEKHRAKAARHCHHRIECLTGFHCWCWCIECGSNLDWGFKCYSVCWWGCSQCWPVCQRGLSWIWTDWWAYAGPSVILY